MVPRARRPMLDSARFGRTPLQFLPALAACCLVAIVALVIVVTQRGPAPALVGLALAILPILLLVVLILYLDRLAGAAGGDVRRGPGHRRDHAAARPRVRHRVDHAAGAWAARGPGDAGRRRG